jgi:transposase-like protein
VFKKIAMRRYSSVEIKGLIVECRENGMSIRQIAGRVNILVSTLIDMQTYGF